MRWILAAFLLVMFTGAGCASKDRVTEGDRELSDQNAKAAKVIQGKTTDPAVVIPAKDIQANSEQQLENWGPPKEPKPYSPAVSKETRDKAKEEHKESPFWPIVGGIAGAALSWFLKSTGFGGIPFIGQAIAALSPKLANGANKNEAVAVGLQVALDLGRDKLDKLAAELRVKLADKPELAALIPTGHMLVDLVRNTLGDRGLLDANTRLYDRNNTGVA